MKSRYSPFVTRRLASSNGSRWTRCRGPSLSKAKSSPACPISTSPPGAGGPGQESRPGERPRSGRSIGRLRRVHGQDVLDVREDQFLMLFLMVQPQLEDGRKARQHVAARGRQERLERRVDVIPVGANLCHRRTRQQSPARARVRLADGVVVRVEEGLEPVVERPVTAQSRPQDEGLEEPARVRQVPLHRADVGHGLDDEVFDLEPLAEGFGQPAHAPDAGAPVLSVSDLSQIVGAHLASSGVGGVRL